MSGVLQYSLAHVRVKKQGHTRRKIRFSKGISIKSKKQDPTTWVTIYFDAAFNSRESKSMAGLVVIDRMGEIINTKPASNSNVSSSFAAKAYAGLHAVRLGTSIGLCSVTIKGDSCTVIQKCKTKEKDKSAISATIRDIQEESKFFQEISFHFINRTNNMLAHKIADEALKRE
ncbi:glycine, alanine and asparagine-rich protein-like [Gossypium australe]|uniref:Glycine, alanine and asparagine-rich protein-like n=1 Tax=Gossypium australe TaxID=47621 RepID=A0A5B6VDX1_9ROSI|nr:glycine, alanine and asparagine-rich protein-like [Gossypium australe]